MGRCSALLAWLTLAAVAACSNTRSPGTSQPDDTRLMTFDRSAASLAGWPWERWDIQQPVQSLRVAVLYFKLADDRFTAAGAAYSDSLRCLVSQWPVDRPAPLWKDQLLVNSDFDPKTAHRLLAEKPNSLTAFFYQMSGGRVWFWGEAWVYEGPPLSKASDKSAWRQNNLRILEWLVRHKDLRPLDNDGDGFVDLLLLVNRARPKFPYGNAKHGTYQGVADGDFLPPVKFVRDPGDPGEPAIRVSRDMRENSVLYQTDCYALSQRNIILHEIAHKLLNSGHRNGLHRWNLLSGAGPDGPTRNGVVFSGFEKYKLGWLQPIELRHDTTDMEIGDVTAANQAVHIPVYGGYLWLEYRRNHRGFETVDEPECPDPSGLPEGLLIAYGQRGHWPELIPRERGSRQRGHAYRRKSVTLYGDGDACTPYTVPGTTIRGRRTGVAITNVRIRGGRVRFDVFLEYYEGTLPPETTWRGTVTVGKDIVVPPGGVLTVMPGTRVRFFPGTSLVVRGRLRAGGSAASPVVFNGVREQPWGGITFEASAGSRSRMQNVRIVGSTDGLRWQGEPPALQNVHVER